ncbi:MAG: T9SS type A sorting domain-containing protein [Bacteroidota bacterium]
MRKLPLVFVFLICTLFYTNAQDYALWVSTRNYQPGPAFPSGSIFLVSYTRQVDNEEHFNICCGQYLYPSGKHLIPENEFPLPIGPVSSSRSTFGILCQYQSPSPFNINKLEAFAFGNTVAFGLCRDIASKNPDEVPFKWHYSVILPKYVQPIDNIRGAEEKLFKDNDVANTFNDPSTSISEVTWYYNYNNLGYRKFPSEIRNTFPMNSTLEEVLANESFQAGGSLTIKYELDPGNNLPKVSSDEIFFNLIASAPSLIGNPEPSNASCFNNTDGSVKLNFDRNINTTNGEQMRYYLYPASANLNFDPTIENPPQVVDDDLLSTLVDEGGGNFSGSFAPRIPEGEYVIIYQIISNLGIVTTAGFSPSFTIQSPSPVQIANVTVAQPQCTSIATGRATVSVLPLSGQDFETGSYSYSKDNGVTWQASPVFEGLAQGSSNTFRVRLLLSGGRECVSLDTETRVIDQIANPMSINSGTGISKEPSSPDSNDGKLFVRVNNGSAPYTFDLYNVTNTTTPLASFTGPDTAHEFENLDEGTYFVVVTDATLCDVRTIDFTLEAAPIPVLDLVNSSISPIACIGDTNGAISIPVSGGTTPYNFQWQRNGTLFSSGTTSGPAIAISNLDSGAYELVVASMGIDIDTNPSATVSSGIILMTQPDAVVLSNAEPIAISCYGAADGRITVVATGGTSYEYRLNNEPNWEPLVGNTISVAQGGFYRVTLRNENDCESNTIENILVQEPDALEVITTVIENTTGNGNSDGSLSITIQGGLLPYTAISWTKDGAPFTPPVGSTDTDLINLGAGSYQVSITDSNSCTASLATPAVITEPAVLQATLQQTVVLDCHGDNYGEITATIQGGVPPYTLTWYEETALGPVALPDTAEILGNLTQGSYSLTVADANANTTSTNILTITQPDLLTITIDQVVDVLCLGEPTGAISTTVSGGTPPYSYFWDNGANTQDLTNVPNGTYTLEVVDNNNCSTNTEVTILGPANPLTITEATLTNLSSYQSGDGSIALTYEGGTPPYTLAWERLSDNTIISDQATISNLPADQYQVTLTDGNGCTLIDSYELTQPDIVEATIVPPTCNGDNNGSISLLVNRGNGSFSYSWSNGSTGPLITNLSAGTYTVTITGFGSEPLVRSYELLDPAPLAVDLGGDRVLCLDQSLSLDVSVADVGVNYQWQSNNGFSSNSPMVTLTESGQYSVTITNPSGCTASGTINIEAIDAEVSAELALSSQGYVGETLIAVDLSYPLPETVTWLVPEGGTIISEDTDELQVSFEEAGEYEIGIRTSRGDCIATAMKKVLVLEKAVSGDGDSEEQQNRETRLETFKVYPNPSTGQFSVEVQLKESTNIDLKVFSFANNAMMAHEKANGREAYTIPFDLSGLTTGVYVIVLETPYETSLRKLILNN